VALRIYTNDNTAADIISYSEITGVIESFNALTNHRAVPRARRSEATYHIDGRSFIDGPPLLITSPEIRDKVITRYILLINTCSHIESITATPGFTDISPSKSAYASIPPVLMP
jgi:hypothetical protein